MLTFSRKMTIIYLRECEMNVNAGNHNISRNLVMKGWAIAMQVSGYSSAVMLAQQFSGIQQKAGGVKKQDFAQMMQNTNAAAQAAGQTNEAAATQEVSEVDEMAAFKQEIYNELEEILGRYSPAVLSHSVHITEDGFQRMKDDPEYRKEIMDWLRADAVASHRLPYSIHQTTTITGVEGRSYGASVDLYNKDPATKQLFDTNKEDAFYYADRRAEQRKRNNEYVTEERLKRELMQKMILEKSIDRKEQLQALDQRMFAQDVVNQKYVQDYLLGTQEPRMWYI